jgi:hypothetical protein
MPDKPRHSSTDIAWQLSLLFTFLRQRTQAMLCKNRDGIGRADLVGGQVVNSEMGFREMMLLMLAAASLAALALMAVTP